MTSALDTADWAPEDSAPLRDPETAGGVLVSLAFWLALLTATVMFALPTLAPKLVALHQLEQDRNAWQTKLVTKEREASRLAYFVDALRTDPDLAAELARVQFDAVRPGEEVITVEGSLAFNHRFGVDPGADENRTIVSATSSSSVPLAWLPWIERLANERELRWTLLGSATVLVLIAFTLLQEATSAPLATASEVNATDEATFADECGTECEWPHAVATGDADYAEPLTDTRVAECPNEPSAAAPDDAKDEYDESLA